MTYLAVPIKVYDPDQAHAALNKALADGAEMIELRLDFLTYPDPPAVRPIVTTARASGIPVIATCRPAWEGGNFQGAESSRQKLLAEAVKAGADYIDIELVCFDDPSFNLNDLLTSSSCKVIISNHDFDTKPADLTNRLKNINSHNPDVSKLAYLSHNINDSFAALDILHQQTQAGRNIIALAMDETGFISRLLAKKLGAFLTFASLSEDDKTAAGQIELHSARRTFRWGRIRPDTCVFGVVGCPVAHSMSPAVLNAAFDETGYNGLYLPMLVDPKREVFFDFIDGLLERKWLDIRGLSVTIPHKHHALEYVRQRQGQLEPLAEKIGAVNTLVIDTFGKLAGYNTDYAGALDALTETLSITRQELKDMRAAVIGAGGVARAIVAGLTEYGCDVTIYNRTLSKAQRLAEEFNCNYLPTNDLSKLPANTNLIVNATSIGMYPQIDNSPVSADILRPNMAVFDTVYNPINTRLLQLASQVGAPTIDGVSMFVNQAGAQFELFTGIDAPREIMANVIKSHLSGKNHQI